MVKINDIPLKVEFIYLGLFRDGMMDVGKELKSFGVQKRVVGNSKACVINAVKELHEEMLVPSLFCDCKTLVWYKYGEYRKLWK